MLMFKNGSRQPNATLRIGSFAHGGVQFINYVLRCSDNYEKSTSMLMSDTSGVHVVANETFTEFDNQGMSYFRIGIALLLLPETETVVEKWVHKLENL